MYGDIMHPNTLIWLERLEQWRGQYAPAGWLALFVNTGEFPVAKDAATAAAEIERLGLTLPTVLDPTYRAIAGANNRYWPALHLFHPDGSVCFRHYGPDGAESVEQLLSGLLKDGQTPNSPSTFEAPLQQARRRWLHPDASPEFYAGFQGGLHRRGLCAPDSSVHRFELPIATEVNRLEVAGKWLVRESGLTLCGPTGRLQVRYCAEKIGVFAGPSEAGPAAMRVRLDGQPVGAGQIGADVGPDSTLVVDRHRFYWLAQHAGLETHVLDLETLTPGMHVYRVNGLPFRGDTEA
jgi:hypothetical protein